MSVLLLYIVLYLLSLDQLWVTFKGLLTDVKCKPETKLEPHFSTEMDATCQILLFSIHQLIIGSYVSVRPWGYEAHRVKVVQQL